MPLEFRLLGPLEVDRDGGQIPLGGAKERALLALLLLRANEVVSRDQLIDRLWARPPGGAMHALEARLSALRKRLQEPVVHTRPGGYMIEVEAGGLDLQRFEQLLRDGRSALAGGDARRAEDLLSSALAVWRGPPLADVAFEPVGLAEAGRLEEERLSAFEERAEARLALGRHQELVAELEGLVAEHPLRERLRGQLMLALYRSGRQAEALEVFREGRALLVEELGIEPGRALQELQAAILRHEPELEPPPVEAAPSAEQKPAAPSQPLAAQRKVVTVLFCDVTDSTALGERLDPEALRSLLDRYFERMKAIVERHGGTVEKFIGDAVMAVFGVPLLHDDDALRACRAACEMREALPELGVEARFGIATGEVLTGGSEPFATGTAVNLAARLEQAAEPGDVLLSADTLALVHAFVEVEAVEPLRLKGVGEAVLAQRLLAAPAETPPRPVRAAFVGRETELRRLRDAFAQAIADRSCQLFTLLGPAGIGKSRLAAEFLAGLDARVAAGRCLSYGDGITYTPVVEIVEELGERPADPEAAAAIGSLLRESRQSTSPEAIAWAFRKTLEGAASQGPVVCLFDDLHWGEAPLLDLVENVADLSRGAPILLLCLARPELHDRRPGWAGGKLNATTLLLAPLSTDESDCLVETLGGGDLALRERIVAAAEGNPLFLEEMVALARETSGGDLALPPTIHALLAARLDRIEATERTLLERGAVEGKYFERVALEALSPDVPNVAAPLESLVRRDLIRPARTALGADAFVFRHQLIRDAAYDALPKAIRADLHRRLAPWLAERGSALVELDELVGYHLEQACRYDRELGRPADPVLVAEARRRLTAAGRRAFLRRDHQATAALLGRAAALVPETLDVALEVDLAVSLFYAGDVGGAERRAADAEARAAAAGDEEGRIVLRIWRGVLDVFMGRGGADLQALVPDAILLFRASGNDLGLFAAHTGAWFVAFAAGRPDDAVAAAETAVEHARRAGLDHYDSVLTPSAGLARWYGSTPANGILAWLEGLDWRGDGDVFHHVLGGVVLAALGRADEALALVDGVLARDDERFSVFVRALLLGGLVDLRLLVGDAPAAVELAEHACALAETTGERANHSSYLLQLADGEIRLGHLDEADVALRRAAELVPGGDPSQHALLRSRILLARGETADAAASAREAIAVADETQYLALRADAHFALGEALRRSNDLDEARCELETALTLYERKEHLVGAAQAREALERLAPAAVSPASGS